MLSSKNGKYGDKNIKETLDVSEKRYTIANLKRCSFCRFVSVKDCDLFAKKQCETEADGIYNEFELLSFEEKHGYYKCNSCGATGCSSASDRCGYCGSTDIELTKKRICEA